jgi:hypothetical protein
MNTLLIEQDSKMPWRQREICLLALSKVLADMLADIIVKRRSKRGASRNRAAAPEAGTGMSV